jgi:hypothetical protein
MKDMKKALAFGVLGAVALAATGWGAAADRSALAKKQTALATEYSLAKESNFYFVLDVIGRKLELRVRGMVLRSWPLQGMRFWGNPGFAGTVELIKKTTLKAPERIVIKPGETEETQPAPAAPAAKPGAKGTAAAAPPAEYELEALELRDMPKTFSLDFDNGLHITVKTKDGGSEGFAKSVREALRWYVRLPLRNLFGSREGKRISELELAFVQGQDAQAIYWHFFDGIKGIVL